MIGYGTVAIFPGEVRGLVVGGPCAGGYIIARPTWDGQVRNRKRSTRLSTVFLPGHYVWSPLAELWVWELNPPCEVGEEVVESRSRAA